MLVALGVEAPAPRATIKPGELGAPTQAAAAVAAATAMAPVAAVVPGSSSFATRSDLSMTTESAIDLAFDLATTNAAVTPAINLVTINYDTDTSSSTATTGRMGGNADYGVARLSPTQTRVKKQTSGSARVYVNVVVGN